MDLADRMKYLMQDSWLRLMVPSLKFDKTVAEDPDGYCQGAVCVGYIRAETRPGPRPPAGRALVRRSDLQERIA